MKKEKEKFESNSTVLPKHDNGEAANVKVERDADVKKPQQAKKRSHDESEDSERSQGSGRSKTGYVSWCKPCAITFIVVQLVYSILFH